MSAAESATSILSATFLSPQELAAVGLSRHQVTHLVREGRLLRLRNGRFVAADTPQLLVSAGRLGGRLDCTSLLAALGVFVRIRPGLHVQFTPATGRLPDRPRDVVAHWRHTAQPRPALAADVIEALAQSCRCQEPRDAIATLDSAWHLGLVDEDGIARVFSRLPHRYQVLRSLLDHRSESGPETFMRLLLRSIAAHVEIQVRIGGVGRVDFVVDGWLIVECDSKEHHQGWDAQRRDRRRDLAAAALGYTTIRPLAEDIMYRRDELAETMRAILASPSRATHPQNSTDRTLVVPAWRRDPRRAGRIR